MLLREPGGVKPFSAGAHFTFLIISFPPHLGAPEALGMFFCISQKQPALRFHRSLLRTLPSFPWLLFGALVIVLGEASETTGFLGVCRLKTCSLLIFPAQNLVRNVRG